MSHTLCVLLLASSLAGLLPAQPAPRGGRPANAKPANANPSAACIELLPAELSVFAGEALRHRLRLRSTTVTGVASFGQPATAPRHAGLQVVLATPRSGLRPGYRTSLALDVAVRRDAPPGRYDVRLPFTISATQPSACRGAAGVLTLRLSVAKPPVPSRSELDAFARAISRSGPAAYSYVELLGNFHKGRTSDLRVVATREVKGLLAARQPQTMRRIAGNFRSDERGNVVLFGDLGRRGEAPLPFTLTAFAGDSYLLAIDPNRDGLVDLAIGSAFSELEGRAKIWLLAGPAGRALWNCLERGEHMSPERVSALYARRAPASGGPPADPCALGGAPSGAGGGPSTGRSTFPGAEQMSAPICPPGPRPPGGAQTSDPPLEPDDDAEGDDAEGDDAETGDSTSSSSAAEAEAARTEEGIERSVRQALERPSGDSGRSAGGVPDSLRNLADTFRGSTVSPSRVEIRINIPFGRPPVGEDRSPSVFVDPRCPRRGSGSYGFWDACKPGTLATCLQQITDPLFAFTGGRCETKTGPNDGITFRCEQEHAGSSQPEAGGGRPSPGSPGSGPTDLPCRHPARPCGQANSDPNGRAFIATTPLGPILLGMCNADCPHTPRF